MTKKSREQIILDCLSKGMKQREIALEINLSQPRVSELIKDMKLSLSEEKLKEIELAYKRQRLKDREEKLKDRKLKVLEGLSQGMTQGEIAVELGLHSNTIYRTIKRMKLELDEKTLMKYGLTSKEQRKEKIIEYLSQGMTHREIGLEVGLKQPRVSEIIKEMKLETNVNKTN